MKKQQGFTLIELIIVIVILGILAVTAAPKFFDFSSDARKSALQGLKAAMQGAAELSYAKAAINGEAKYPEISLTALAESAEVSQDDWIITAPSVGASGTARFAWKDNDGTARDDCYVDYTVVAPTATTEASYTLTVENSGC